MDKQMARLIMDAVGNARQFLASIEDDTSPVEAGARALIAIATVLTELAAAAGEGDL